MGKQDSVLPDAARPSAAREHGGVAGRPAWARSRARAPDTDAGEARQPVLPGGDSAHAGGDWRSRGRAPSLSADAAAGGPTEPGDGTDDPGGADRPAAAGGEADPSGGLGDRQARTLRAA